MPPTTIVPYPERAPRAPSSPHEWTVRTKMLLNAAHRHYVAKGGTIGSPTGSVVSTCSQNSSAFSDASESAMTGWAVVARDAVALLADDEMELVTQDYLHAAGLFSECPTLRLTQRTLNAYTREGAAKRARQYSIVARANAQLHRECAAQ